MSPPPDVTSVTSAKVSRSGAIWVAAITAAGGFATAVATGSIGLLGKTEPITQRWIQIEAVQIVSAPPLPAIDRIRLVAQVNGVSYAYPTSVNSVWAAVGPGMASERYPLPIGAEVFRVKFYGFGLTADGKIPRYENRDTVEYQVRQIPVRGAKQALQLSGSMPSGLATGLIVRYTIE